MRLMDENMEPIWYANQQHGEIAYDQWGNEIGFQITYSEPAKIDASISSAKGETVIELFGAAENYDKTFLLEDRYAPFTELSRLWVDNLVNGEPPRDESGNLLPHDYEVYLISPSRNQCYVAIRKVNVSYAPTVATMPEVPEAGEGETEGDGP